MQNNIIKLPDTDSMHYHNFCNLCHYELFGEYFGVKYCPHCGQKLSWKSKKANDFHKLIFEFSQERYNEMLKRKEQIDGKRDSD